jgi:hypothetical protein
VVHRNGQLWAIFTAGVRTWNRSLHARVAALTGF